MVCLCDLWPLAPHHLIHPPYPPHLAQKMEHVSSAVVVCLFVDSSASVWGAHVCMYWQALTGCIQSLFPPLLSVQELYCCLSCLCSLQQPRGCVDSLLVVSISSGMMMLP